MGVTYGYGMESSFDREAGNGRGNGLNHWQSGDGLGVDQRLGFDNGDGMSWSM
jgi:hypothetical protein